MATYGTAPPREFRFSKSCFTPTQTLEFLGFLVNTRDMTLHLPDYKVEAIKADCNNLIACDEVSVRELSQLIGRLTASIQAIFPAPLHYRHLQHLKHQALAQRKEGLGRGVPKSKNRGAVLSDGAEASHNLFGASSGLLSREASHGQHFGCSLCEPSKGDSLPCPSQFGPSQFDTFPASWMSQQIGNLDTSTIRAIGSYVHRCFRLWCRFAGDLFADRLNTQLPQFFSWKPDPMGLGLVEGEKYRNQQVLCFVSLEE